MTPVPRIARVAILAALLSPAGALRGYAQPLPPLEEYQVRAFGPASGLLYADVRGLALGEDGHIYAATGRGLMRFDGYRFRPVTLAGAQSTAISLMHPDRLGRLWIRGTANELLGYVENDRLHPTPPVGGLTRAFAPDDDGSAWFGSRAGFFRFGPRAESPFSHHTSRDGLPNDTAMGVFRLSDGMRVAVTFTQLARVEAVATSPNDFRFVPFGPTYRFGGALRVDANGLWLTARAATGSFYVLRYHQGRFSRYDMHDRGQFMPFESFDWQDDPLAPSIAAGSWPISFGGRRGHYIKTALRARDGALWLVMNSEPEGRHELVRYVQGRLDTIPLRASIEFQAIGHLIEDHEGGVWVGTDRTLFQVTARRVAALTRKHGLAEDFTTPILQTRDGALWVGTWGGGLHRFADGRLTHRYTRANGLPHDDIRALHQAADGTLWVGTARGVAALRGGRVVLAEPGDHVRAFAETRDDLGAVTLWIGTEDRLLSRTERGVVAHRPAHWRGRGIWALHAARDGSLWIGSERGLFRMVGDSLRGFDRADGLAAPFVASISEETDGTMWFGTYEHGLHRYRGDRFVRLTTADGLLHDGIWRMLPDGRGGVWMSTDAGIFRVGHARLHEVADAVQRGERKGATLAPMVFTEAEGMPSRESNRASPGGWRLDDGRLVFNNRSGVVVIDPARAAELQPAPRAVVLDATADGTAIPVESPSTAKLPPGTRQLAFEFAALSFTAPEQNRYRYRLDGYDDGWVSSGTERRARYTSLPAGRYTFLVQGASATSGWGETASLSFVLVPFVWQRWWFRLFVVAGLLGIAVGAYRYRVARLMEMERLRLRIASDLHDDVGSNLSSIALLSEMLKDDSRLEGLERRQLERINHAAEETIGALRDIIWLVAPRHDDLVELVRRMRGVAGDMLNGTAYRFETRSIEGRRLGTTFMRNVLLIYKEALHNVLKHARAHEVVVEVIVDGEQLVLTIQDDGVGFDEASIRPGHGLENMRRRAHQAGGELEIAHSGGGGTRITFTGPMAESRDGRIPSRTAP